MAFVRGLQDKIGKPGRRVYEVKPVIPRFQGVSLKDKLQALANAVGTKDRDQRIRRNTTWYLMALYYAGYQNVEIASTGNAWDVYEREDFYTENQFRRHVDAVVNMLSKGEGEFTPRPESSQPADIATSRAAGPILDIMKTNIGYDRLRDEKNRYKALFGNAFVFVDYVIDKKYGTVVHPVYDYPEIPDEEGGDPLLSKVVAGYKTKNKGSEIGVVCSPLEVSVPADVKGFENVPYLRWVTRQHVEVLNHAYPGLGIGGGTAPGDQDMAQQYIEVLNNLSGNVLGDAIASDYSNQAGKVELARTWLQPCMFEGDAELLREFPEGVHVATIGGRIVDYYAENLLDHWTHEVLIPSPHSLLGDGLYDALLMQDQINELNTLLIRHMRYSTVGHKIYDANVIDPKDVVNDPANGWIPGRPSMDKNIQQAVAELKPNTLSQDVPAWLSTVKGAMQDMTSAYDPAIGKGLGANTPYSQSVFLSERAQSRWQGSLSFNRPELMRFYKQLLKIAHDDWVDERQKAIADNVGGWTFQSFSQADLQGNVDIQLSNTDMTPRSRAEQIQGLQMLTELSPLIPMLPPKQKLRVEEILGLPPDSNPMSTQVSRAYRAIEKLKSGQAPEALHFVEDPVVQVPVFQDFLAGEDGESLLETDPETYHAIYMYMQNLMMMLPAMPGAAAAPPAPQGQPGQGPQQKQQPGGQPGQKGGGPNSGQQPDAQSPAPAPPVQPPSPS